MIMHWPQLVWLALVMIGLGVDVARHGRPKTGKYNLWASLAALLIAVAILYFGGFFAGASP